jgi:ribosomal protein L18
LQQEAQVVVHHVVRLTTVQVVYQEQEVDLVVVHSLDADQQHYQLGTVQHYQETDGTVVLHQDGLAQVVFHLVVVVPL